MTQTSSTFGQIQKETNVNITDFILAQVNKVEWPEGTEIIVEGQKPVKTAREYYSAMVGMCSDCKEYTSVIDSCCGAPVLVEGSSVCPLRAEQEIEEEETA